MGMLSVLYKLFQDYKCDLILVTGVHGLLKCSPSLTINTMQIYIYTIHTIFERNKVSFGKLN